MTELQQNGASAAGRRIAEDSRLASVWIDDKEDIYPAIKEFVVKRGVAV